MAAKKYRSILMLFVIIILCTNLVNNVQVVHADGETPTEPPAPTQVETEPPTEAPVEETLVPIESTPIPEEATAIPIAEVLTQVPEEATAIPIAEVLTQVPQSTEVVVLDESANPLPLATQEAAEIMEVVDPMWCPEGVLPGGDGCSTNYTGATAITDLISNMVSNPSFYDENGVIYFTAINMVQPLALTTSSLGASAFDTLNDFDLTLQGGWNNKNGTEAIFLGYTNFGTNAITIGTETNPWVGNVTLNDIRLNGVSTTNALTIYTTGGDITLSDVDVYQQTGGNHTAVLDSNSGDITVQNGSTFDGNSAGGTPDESQGFSANTGSGSITISDTIFSDSRKNNPGTYDGATLSAPIVTLTNVTATTNDGNGLVISNTSLVTLNTITSSSNGLSGVLINGTGSTIARVTGGTFQKNRGHGIEIYDGSLFILTDPICPDTADERNRDGCYNVIPSIDTSAPVIKPKVSGTTGLNGWYTSDVSMEWLVTDDESGILSSSGCIKMDLTAETTGATATCSATNNIGLSNLASTTIKIDKTAPNLSLPSDITIQAMSPSGAVVSYLASVTDNLDASVSVACSPASGLTFSLGTTTVNCSATDTAGNTSSDSFQVTVGNATAIIPTSPASPPSSTLGPSITQPNSSAFITPITGGEAINLDCNSAFWAFGIKLSYINLCNHKTTIHSESLNDLPAKLPDGFSFVMGLHVNVLSENQILNDLPDGSGIELDFPIYNQSNDQFAVLYWNDENGDGKGEWVEISQQIGTDEISQIVNTSTDNEFYQLINNSMDVFYPILTTAKTGCFVFVKK